MPVSSPASIPTSTPESGSWIAPGSATKAEFEKTRTLIGDYVAETRRQIDEFMSFRRTATG